MGFYRSPSVGNPCLFHAFVFPWRKLGGLMAPIGFETYGGCEKLSNEKTWLFRVYGGFLKWWYPTTMSFPTKNDNCGVFWGYHHLRKHPYRRWDPTQLYGDYFLQGFRGNNQEDSWNPYPVVFFFVAEFHVNVTRDCCDTVILLTVGWNPACTCWGW